RAWAADPTSEAAVESLAASLEKRGRRSAADQVWRAHAEALAPIDPARCVAVHAQRRAFAMAVGDSVMALGATLDELLDRDAHGMLVEPAPARILEVGGEPHPGSVVVTLAGHLGLQAMELERAAAAVAEPQRLLLLSAAADRHRAAGDTSAA